jgi:anti-anti-sigma regulatory factor
MAAVDQLLEQSRDAVVAAIADSLTKKTGSVFKLRGRDATVRAVSRLFGALLDDLRAGGRHQLRAGFRGILGELSDTPLAFRDLKLQQEALRSGVLAALPAGTVFADARALEDWFHELTQQGSLYLVSLREEMIERQASEIEVKLAEQRSLSIPIVPIHEGVLIVPLVGSLDAYRAQVLTARVLDALPAARARFLLLDISGVAKVDAEVLQHLLKTVRGARLLGCHVLLSGLSTASAVLLARVDLDLAELTIHRSLQEGLAYALATLSLRR